MQDRVWVGSIFLRSEGGFGIVMRALNHYNRRLHRISDSPEISGAGAMFGSILQSEAMRIMPRLRPIADRLRAGLTDAPALAALEGDIEIIEKAMICYRSDVQKAATAASSAGGGGDGAGGSGGYYSRLIEGNPHAESDLPLIDGSIRKLKQYD